MGGLPAVTGLSPARGPTTGGTTVVITGTDLNGATSVEFGMVAAAGFTVDSVTQITATTPASMPAGPADVTVMTSYGSSSWVAPGFSASASMKALRTTSGTTSGSDARALHFVIGRMTSTRSTT